MDGTITNSELKNVITEFIKECKQPNNPNWMLQPFILTGACALAQKISDEYDLQIDVKELLH